MLQSFVNLLPSLATYAAECTQLVAKATAFLGTVVKMPSQKPLFESQQTLEAFCEKIVLPNMTLRTFEEELFEDDPAEYVRRDLDTAGERFITCTST